jgi:O-Antigen ligase
LVKVLIASNVFQFVLVIYQTASQKGIGLRFLGENKNPMFQFSGGDVAALGTYPHPYLYAIFALLCVAASVILGMHGSISRPWAYGGGFVGAFLIGSAGSRGSLMSVVGVILIGVFGLVLLELKRRFRAGLHLSITLGLIPALVWNSGLWLTRTKTPAGSVDSISSGRWELMKGGFQLFRAHPALGVGMGQYVNVFRSEIGFVRAGSPEIIVHNFWLLLIAEGGIPMALVGLSLTWILVSRLRSHAMVGLILFVSIAATALLDHSLASSPGGFVVLAVWLAVAGFWNHEDSEPDTLGETRAKTSKYIVESPKFLEASRQ